MKTETELQFLEWFNEIEGFGMRSERFYDDYSRHDVVNNVKWLKAAFEAGFEARFGRSATNKRLPALLLPRKRNG